MLLYHCSFSQLTNPEKGAIILYNYRLRGKDGCDMAGRKRQDFIIVNRRTKKALQATGLDNGLVVEQAALNGSDAQVWSEIKTEGGSKLMNKGCAKLLDVVAEGVESGTRVQTWEDVDGASQVWQLVTVTSTYKKLVNVRSGKVLDIADLSEEDGAPAQIWDDVDGIGQQWKLVPAESAEKKPTEKKPTAKKTTAQKPAAKKAAEKKSPEKKTAEKAVAEVKAEPKTEPAPVKPEPTRTKPQGRKKKKASKKAAAKK